MGQKGVNGVAKRPRRAAALAVFAALAVVAALAGVAAMTLGASGAGAAPPTAATPLTQPPGAEGCVAQRGAYGCAAGRATEEVTGPPALSPDGKNAYLAAIDPAGDVIEANAIDVLDRDQTTGALVQAAGAAGCLSANGKAGCASDPLLHEVADVVVSPDGKQVYATAQAGVLAFSRDPESGALTPLAGTAGCLGGPHPKPGCRVGAGLEGADEIAFSPDGLELYVTSLEHPTVAILKRDPATGTLTQARGGAGCVVATARPATCATAGDLASTAIVATADGRSVYAITAGEDEGVATFDRAADGTLHRRAGRAGCLAPRARKGCRALHGVIELYGLALSPDGRSLYVVSSTQGAGGSVAILRRGAGGTLSQPGGKAGCVSANGNHGKCEVAKSLSDPFGIAVAPDGGTVYVTTLFGLAALTRSASGALTEPTGTAACVTRTGSRCVKARGIETAEAVAVSPDGADVYVTSSEPGAVITLRR